jgi:hypothetical protein
VQPPLEKVGDGTVPAESVKLPGMPTIRLEGSHAELPSLAAQDIFRILYPEVHYSSFITRKERSGFLSFLFDCPIEVTITMPDGLKRVSTSEDGPKEVGEVASSEDLLWMIMPKQEGDYQISIKALEDTEVRYWIDRGEITMLNLKKDERIEREYSSDSQPVEENTRFDSINAKEALQEEVQSLTLPQLNWKSDFTNFNIFLTNKFQNNENERENKASPITAKLNDTTEPIKVQLEKRQKVIGIVVVIVLIPILFMVIKRKKH